jgi:hypothetical protein
VGTGFEPGSRVGVEVVAIVVTVAVPRIAGADPGSRVEVVVIVVARVAVAVPRIVEVGIVLVSTAAAVAVGIPAVLDIPALVPGSRVVAVGVIAASRSSVGMVVLLRQLRMLQGLHVLCDHCECVAICRGLPIAQTVQGRQYPGHGRRSRGNSGGRQVYSRQRRA